VYEEFLEKCMKYVEAGAAMIPEKEGEAVKRINRSLSIITQFLEIFENQSAAAETGGVDSA
jgi:hypothetical protein